jgi:RNA polymerase sigma-70 factor (ECF subfamily)
MIEAAIVNPRQWVSQHADFLYAFALVRVDDEELARDLVQETFLAALERLDRFEGRSSERTWLTAILKNKVMDVYRKKSAAHFPIQEDVRRDGAAVEFFEAENGHWTSEQAPRAFGIEQDPLAAKEFEQILKQCMQKLPNLWLSVFTLKHIDEASTPVICNKLKISAANFWVIIHRAKVNLRACLQKNWSI